MRCSHIYNIPMTQRNTNTLLNGPFLMSFMEQRVLQGVLISFWWQISSVV